MIINLQLANDNRYCILKEKAILFPVLFLTVNQNRVHITKFLIPKSVFSFHGKNQINLTCPLVSSSLWILMDKNEDTYNTPHT